MHIKPKPAEKPFAYSAENLLHSAAIIHNEEVTHFAKNTLWHMDYVKRRILSRIEMEAIGGLMFMELHCICEEHK